jgi:predicted enzyme related to lactoylglutathione lyase
MSTAIRHVTIDCADAYTIASFWSKVLERPLDDDDHPGDPAAIVALDEGPGLLFMSVPEGKTVKNRLHFDLTPSARTRDEEVDRVILLGATVYEDHRTDDGLGWVTLRDPEGNEFCVVRGPLDRKPSP